MKLFRFETLVVGFLLFLVVVGINPLQVRLDAPEVIAVVLFWAALTRFLIDSQRAARRKILISRTPVDADWRP
jgi:hypothetical protein